MSIRPSANGKTIILLADVPNAGVSNVSTTQRSGNRRHDSRSGKFSPGGGRKPAAKGGLPDQQVDHHELRRMLDAVRDAAREFDTPDEGDVREFLKGRAADPSKVNVADFLARVKQQRLDDVADLVDQQMRSSGPLKQGRRKVTLRAPRGFLKRAIGGLDADQIAEVMHRLEARGHDAAEVEGFFGKRVHEDTHADAVTKKHGIAAADWAWDEPGEHVVLDYPDRDEQDTLEFAERIMRSLPQPVINVTPQITVQAPRPMRTEVLRDERGLALGTRQIPEDDASRD